MARRVKSVETYKIISNKTGEVVAEQAIFIGKEPYVKANRYQVFAGFLPDVMASAKRVGKAIVLLLWMVEHLFSEGLEVYMNAQFVSEELGISPKTYHNWVRILIKEGLIEKVHPNLYRLIPFSKSSGKKSVLIVDVECCTKE